MHGLEGFVTTLQPNGNGQEPIRKSHGSIGILGNQVPLHGNIAWVYVEDLKGNGTILIAHCN